MNGQLVITLTLCLALVGVSESTVVVTVGAISAATASAIASLKLAAVTAAGLGVAAGVGAAAALRKAGQRGRRDITSCLPVQNPEVFFTMAANSDVADCGRRFVCELEATPEKQLTEEEILIRNVFGRGDTTINGSARSFFAEAGNIGATNGTTACAATFSACPFDRKTIFLAFQAANKV